MANNTSFSDKDLHDISVKQMYNTSNLKSGDKLPINQKYTIIDIQHDPQTGFDAMAVKDVSGNVMIVYGGTNNNDGHQDGITDAGIAGTYVGGPTPKQFEQAKQFRDKVAGAHPNSSITLTGHSLGGGLSNAVALQSGDKAVNFNPAPLPYDMGTVLGTGVNRTDIINYQTADDPLGYLSSVFSGYLPGQIKIFGLNSHKSGTDYLMGQHNMDGVQFDSDGNLIDENGDIVSNFPNSNLSTGSPFYDELLRSSRAISTGSALVIQGRSEFQQGLILLANPITVASGVKHIMSGLARSVVGLLAVGVGAIRGIIVGIKKMYEFGVQTTRVIGQKITEMIGKIYDGFVHQAMSMYETTQTGLRFMRDVQQTVLQKGKELGTALISAGYDMLEQMYHMIRMSASFIQNEIQQVVEEFIELKEELFEMTYSYIRQNIHKLFVPSEIITLLGSLAVELMPDIIAMNWTCVDIHVRQKIDAFYHEAKRDFMTSTRGFNHELIEEIGEDLAILGREMQQFGERVGAIKNTFEEMEMNIRKQVRRIGENAWMVS